MILYPDYKIKKNKDKREPLKNIEINLYAK